MTDLCQILAAALLFLAAAVHAVPRVEEPFTELELEQATGRVMGKRGELFGKRASSFDRQLRRTSELFGKRSPSEENELASPLLAPKVLGGYNFFVDGPVDYEVALRNPLVKRRNRELFGKRSDSSMSEEAVLSTLLAQRQRRARGDGSRFTRSDPNAPRSAELPEVKSARVFRGSRPYRSFQLQFAPNFAY
ncbi:hypothetical protein AAVH_15833 [Aphelenchoides avenae]|nr:hypothetical protein AAVH_15833 [Aphelenchus avenae]